MDYADDILKSGTNVSQPEICIMSPFQAQVRRLRKSARERNLPGLNIGPMEAFQGLESRVVIICTTRARKRFLDDDETKGIGIISNEKKFNVAITRAKEGLIVIGNPWTMATNYYWDQFLRFCYRNGLWETDLEDDIGVRNQQDGGTNEWIPREDDPEEASDKSDVTTSLEKALMLTEREQRDGNTAKRRLLGGYDTEALLWQRGIDAQQSLDPEDWPGLP